jgi:DNA-binding CsgD family transcriptional regulator
LTVVDETLASVTDPELADPLRASLAIVLAQVPRPAAAIEAVRPLLDRPSGPHFYRAAYAASLALAVSGRLEQAVAIGRRGYEAHRHLGATVRFLVEAQHIGPALALLGAGKTQEAADLVSAGYDAAVAARDSDLQAAFALHAGRVCVHRGRLTTAGRHFREAAAIYREPNDVASLRWALGGVALAAGMRAARAASAAAVVEIDALDPSPVQLFELDFVERGRAWAAAAAGERSQAVTILRAAAERAAATDQLISEALLRHDLARLGEARHHQARLTELAEHVDGELVPTLAEHAYALVSGAAAGLEAAARRLAALDAALLAHEAATDAAAAWRAEGFRRRAEECEDQARRLAADCEGSRSPASRTEGGYVALTVREHEVGALAADGLTSREIADKLEVSPRTVENHLQRIYDKLGVSSRQELAAVLDR